MDETSAHVAETILGMTKSSEPGGSTVAGIWFEMHREHPAYYVLVQIQSECQVDLPCSFFWALRHDSSVEGLTMMANRAMRLGFKNSDQKPSRARSCVERFGARSRDLQQATF